MCPLAQREDFMSDPQVTYLDTASVALLPRDAHAAVQSWLDRIGSEGTRWFDEAAEEQVTHPLRAAMARMLHCSIDDIAVGSSATELLASVAWAVAPQAGTNVVGSAMAFPSTTLPWARVARATNAEIRLVGSSNGPLHPGDIERAIDRNTSVVCVSDVEYQTGQRHNLAAVVERARWARALVVVDASQSLGMLRCDPTALGIDVMVASGYKWMCGPFGAGVLYLAPELHGRLDPGILGFRSPANMWELDSGITDYPATAARFESGSFFYGAALGLAASIGYVGALGAERVELHCTSLARRLASALRELGADVWPAEGQVVSGIVAASFSAEDQSCVLHALRREGVVLSERGGRLRFSLHVYNGSDDVDRVLEVVSDALMV